MPGRELTTPLSSGTNCILIEMYPRTGTDLGIPSMKKQYVELFRFENSGDTG